LHETSRELGAYILEGELVLFDVDCGQYLTGSQADKYNREKGSSVNTTIKYSVFFAPNPAIDLTTSNYSARIDEAEDHVLYARENLADLNDTHLPNDRRKDRVDHHAKA
jgi:hypothetical protein